MSLDTVLNEARESILQSDEEKAVAVARQALAEGLDPLAVIEKGFCEGITRVGDLFGRGELFLPELILSAEVMKKATAIFDQALKGQNVRKRGKILIATVEGDVHDIGKGIVISLMRAQGIEVFDLGREVPVAAIIEKALEYEVDIIGTSALLTTTMTEQKKLEDELRKRGLRERFRTMVGGAPCTKRWADKIGANAYAEDAAEAVKIALGYFEA
jgi:trimethylamine corrinoid protein